MNIIRNGNTTKYIHKDGSETSFKNELSGEYTNDLDNPELRDNHKYSLVISCSSGCKMKCAFCHLTELRKPYRPLEAEAVLSNLKQVILNEYTRDTSIGDKFIKLC